MDAHGENSVKAFTSVRLKINLTDSLYLAEREFYDRITFLSRSVMRDIVLSASELVFV